jgi:hypothetical protein
LLLALSLTSVAAPVLAASPSARASHAPAAVHAQQLTIDITTTGSTVWGTVTARYAYKGHTVSRSTRQSASTFTVPRGVTVHLTQKPLNSVTWPFEQWTIVRGAQTVNRSVGSTTVKVNHNLKVTAVYFFN